MSSRYGSGFPWSEEAVTCLRAWRADGLSSAQIATGLAKEFGAPVSRSAVIGKLSRMGIEMPVDRKKIMMSLAQPRRAPKPVKPKVQKELVAQRRAADLIKAEKAKATVIPIRPVVDADLIAVEPKDIMGLTHGSCRWPLNRTAEDGSMLFCCNQKDGDRPYCEGHAKRAYSRVITKDQRQDERRLREQRREEALAAGRREHVFGFGLAKRFA